MDKKSVRGYPDAFFVNIWRKISSPVKTAFFTCLIAGMLVHIFAFTNVIPNSDGLSRIYEPQQMTAFGRWFLHFATAPNGYTQLPVLIGFLSVLFMAVSAALVTDLFQIRSQVAAGVIGVILIVFPSVAYTYLYMFTASAYFLGVLLAVLGVWMTQRYRWGLLPGMLLLACAVGTYQAYAAAAAALSLMVVLISAITDGKSVRETVKHGLRNLVFLIGGMVLYFIILRVFLAVKGLSLASYLGMNSVASGYPFSELPRILLRTYSEFLGYFLIPGKIAPYTTVFAAVLNGILIAGAVVIAIGMMIRSGLFKSAGKLILTVIMIVLLPVAMNLVKIISPLSEATPIMRYSFVFTYVFVVALFDRHFQSRKNEKRAGLGGLWLLPMALLIFVSFYVDNLAYLASYQAHRATESFANRLAERVESAEGYENGMEVVIIGTFPEDIYYNDVPAFSVVEHYSCETDSVLLLNKHIYYYLNDWLNIPWEEPDEKTMSTVAESREFKEMPLYPNDGSVVVSEDKVIVKLGETYTPKQSYEIEYENRR